VLADIPGLIEGAAEGAGIGDRFLGHIERCRVLIHLIDINGTDPAEALEIIEEELAAYGAGLDEKPRLIALNKIDLVDPNWSAFIKELKAAGAKRVFRYPAATGRGMDAAARCRDRIPACCNRNRAPGRRTGRRRRQALVADLSRQRLASLAHLPNPQGMKIARLRPGRQSRLPPAGGQGRLVAAGRRGRGATAWLEGLVAESLRPGRAGRK
jgi:hypothetical protein